MNRIDFAVKTHWRLILFLIFCSCTYTSDYKKKGLKNKHEQELIERAKQLDNTTLFDEAKLVYDTLISIDSTKGVYYFKRGYCYSMLLNNDEFAIKDYFKSIQLNYKKKQSAYLNIGVLYRFKAQYDSALYYYDKCLEIDPNNFNAIREKK